MLKEERFQKGYKPVQMAGYFLLIVAAANIGPAQNFLHPEGDIRIVGFLLPLWLAQAVSALPSRSLRP